MLVKICGATAPRDLDVLAASGADLAGLWHGVGGTHELSTPSLSALAARATDPLQPVLVTFSRDARRLAEIAHSTGIAWVQLHGYQPPGTVRALKASGPPDLVVVKVLHVATTGCVERRLVPAYERAGADLFLLDTVTADGQVGSTGQPLPARAALDLAGNLSRPFLLAGGVSAEPEPGHLALAEHPLCTGIDVDTAARDGHGRLAAGRVGAIVRRWRAGVPGPRPVGTGA